MEPTRRMNIHIYILLLTLCLSNLSVRAQETKVFDLVARMSGTTNMWDGETVNWWGFKHDLGGDAEVPGPPIIVNEGDSVIINVINQSPLPHTVHMHGVDVDQANDGVGATSFDIPGLMGEGTYKFVASHAGTFIYHCHVGTVVHMPLGMYGPFIVKAAGGDNQVWTGGPAYDKEYTWMMAEIDSEWNNDPPSHTEIPAYEPDYFLINGKSMQQLNDSTISISSELNQRVYLRLINIGFTDMEVIFPGELAAEIVASDGRPLPASVYSDTVKIYPGERYGVLLTFSSEVEDPILVNYYDMYDGSNPLFTNTVPIGAEAPPEPPTVKLDQIDTYEDLTTWAWRSGGPNPNPPVNVAEGGPDGVDDAYLHITSTGVPGPGGKLAAFNSAQWHGNYINEGVQSIPLQLNNFGDTELHMRLKFDGPGGSFVSKEAIVLPPNSGWQSVAFPIDPADLTGGVDILGTLSNVTQLWLFHNPTPSFPPPLIEASLGVDDMIAAGEATFPVEYLYFDAELIGQHITLTWETTQEINNAGFEIEMRTSEALNRFDSIGYVKGKGYSTTPQSYQFRTDELTANSYLFRLKQIDQDGEFSYSHLVEAVLTEGLVATIYPNPVKNLAKLELNLVDRQKLDIGIYDLKGQLIAQTYSGTLSSGKYSFDLDVSQLAAGVYFCHIRQLDSQSVKKLTLIKQ